MAHKPKIEKKSYITPGGDAAELGPEFFRTAKRGRPPMLAEKRKQKVTIMLDPEIINHFKKGGQGWQTRMNEALGATIKKRKQA
jgi:uncharacterized protein (DUF4415 family)